MFFKTFAQKELERKGREYDRLKRSLRVVTGYDAHGNFLPPQQLVEEIERLRGEIESWKALVKELESKLANRK